MRVLHLNSEKTWRGGERQTLLLAAALQDAGIENVIACRRDAPLATEAAKRPVPATYVGASNPGLLLDLLRLVPAFDVVHCHTGRGHSIAAIQSLWNRTPILVTRRVDFLPSRSWFNRFKFARAKKIVCISQFIANQLAGWGIPQAKLMVIPSAVPLPQAAGRPDAEPHYQSLTPQSLTSLRQRLGIPAGKKLVGNIAAFVPHKDQATLLRAAGHMLAQRSDVAIVIIGEGELRPQLERLRRELKLEHAVHFAGFIPEAEKFLPAFDVFAMSSAMEGLGSIVLDAFAAGVPVVATAGGGLPELVHHRETGLLVPVGDDKALASAVLELLESPPLAARLASMARAFVTANFSVQAMADRYLEVYHELI